MLCDLTLAQVILNFTIGGIGLRVIIAFLKKALGWTGFLAVLLTLVCCFAATAAYLLIVHGFTLVCLILIGLAVYAGSQVAYSISKPQK
jgi:Kef-type K+ transport system membrane component KefB